LKELFNHNQAGKRMNESISKHSVTTEDYSSYKPVLKVLGLGGGGCNAVNRMIELGLNGVEFIAANTDAQALNNCLASKKVQLGPKATRGLGAGGNPQMGEIAAMESSKELAAALAGADLVFLTAGMGGGTGTGSIPVAAEIARKLGAVTIAIVTTPFGFEMGRRQQNANDGLAALNRHTDTLIAISNDRLLDMRGGNLTIDLAFRVADDVLRQAIQGITELITEPGLINVDFANVRRLMKLSGGAFLAIGQGQGDDKVDQALHKALNHPLVDNISLEHASGILVNFTGGDDLSLHEVNAALTRLQEQANPDIEIVMGVINDKRLNGRVQAILIVTGLGARPLEEFLIGSEKIQKPSIPAQHEIEKPVAVQEILDAEADIARQTENKLTPIPTSNNLDLPAFLRRERYTGHSLQTG
jgi:cell division protein FtsZ